MEIEQILKQIEEFKNRIDILESQVKENKINISDLKREVDDLKIKLNSIESNTQTIISINEKQDTKLDNLLNKLVDATIQENKIEKQGNIEIKKLKWDAFKTWFTSGGIGIIIITAILKFFGLM